MDEAQVLFDILYRRRSVRRYEENHPVERDKITLLLKAAMAAPSACNLQPWEFIVVDEPEGLGKLKECIGGGNGRYYNAPAALVVCGNRRHIPWESDGAMDCCAAIENLLLAATTLGLGAVWVGDIDAEAIKGLLDIPEHTAVNSVVLFGYPAEQKRPRTQYREDAVYWQKYDPGREHEKRTMDWRFFD